MSITMLHAVLRRVEDVTFLFLMMKFEGEAQSLLNASNKVG